MTHFSCGCPLTPETPEQRCDEHRDWWCHTPDGYHGGDRFCPPCYRRRLLTVNLDRSATPTRFLK